MTAVPRELSDRLPTTAPVRRAERTRLFMGATALASLVVLGAVGVALGGGQAPDGPSVIPVKNVATSTVSTSSSTSSTEATPTSSTASTGTSAPIPTEPSPLDKLYGVLPPGYNATSCGPSDNPNPQALATVDCGQLDQATGPTSARFSLFPDVSSLAIQFQDGVNGNAISQCPGSIDSPRSWHYDATPAFSAGSLACGTHNNAPDLMWTKDDVLLLGDVQGPELDNLYGWWLSLG